MGFVVKENSNIYIRRWYGLFTQHSYPIYGLTYIKLPTALFKIIINLAETLILIKPYSLVSNLASCSHNSEHVYCYCLDDNAV